MLPCEDWSVTREFLREHLSPPALELAEGLLEAAVRDALGSAGHLDGSGMPELSTSRHVAEWKAVTCHRTPRSGKRGLSQSATFPIIARLLLKCVTRPLSRPLSRITAAPRHVLPLNSSFVSSPRSIQSPIQMHQSPAW